MTSDYQKLQWYFFQLNFGRIQDPVAADYPALFKQVLYTFAPFDNYITITRLSLKQIVNVVYNLLFIYYDYIPRLVPEALFQPIASRRITEQKIKITLLLTKLFVWFNVKHSKLEKQYKGDFEIFVPEKYRFADFKYHLIVGCFADKGQNFFSQQDYNVRLKHSVTFDCGRNDDLDINALKINENRPYPRKHDMSSDDEEASSLTTVPSQQCRLEKRSEGERQGDGKVGEQVQEVPIIQRFLGNKEKIDRSRNKPPCPYQNARENSDDEEAIRQITVKRQQLRQQKQTTAYNQQQEEEYQRFRRQLLNDDQLIGDIHQRINMVSKQQQDSLAATCTVQPQQPVVDRVGPFPNPSSGLVAHQNPSLAQNNAQQEQQHFSGHTAAIPTVPPKIPGVSQNVTERCPAQSCSSTPGGQEGVVTQNAVRNNDIQQKVALDQPPIKLQSDTSRELEYMDGQIRKNDRMLRECFGIRQSVQEQQPPQCNSEAKKEPIVPSSTSVPAKTEVGTNKNNQLTKSQVEQIQLAMREEQQRLVKAVEEGVQTHNFSELQKEGSTDDKHQLLFDQDILRQAIMLVQQEQEEKLRNTLQKIEQEQLLKVKEYEQEKNKLESTIIRQQRQIEEMQSQHEVREYILQEANNYQYIQQQQELRQQKEFIEQQKRQLFDIQKQKDELLAQQREYHAQIERQNRLRAELDQKQQTQRKRPQSPIDELCAYETMDIKVERDELLEQKIRESAIKSFERKDAQNSECEPAGSKEAAPGPATPERQDPEEEQFQHIHSAEQRAQRPENGQGSCVAETALHEPEERRALGREPGGAAEEQQCDEANLTQTNVNDQFIIVNRAYSATVNQSLPPLVVRHSRQSVQQGERIMQRVNIRRSSMASSFDENFSQLKLTKGVDCGTSPVQGVTNDTFPPMPSLQLDSRTEGRFKKEFMKSFISSRLGSSPNTGGTGNKAAGPNGKQTHAGDRNKQPEK